MIRRPLNDVTANDVTARPLARLIRFAFLVTAMSSSLAIAGAQQPPADSNPPAPPPKNDPAPAPAETPKPPDPVVDDAGAASRTLKEQEASLADKEPAKRLAALGVFRIHRNEAYVKAIAPLLRDKSDEVAIEAAKALGNQPFAKSSDVLLEFATNKKVAIPEAVLAEAVGALATTGLGKKGYDKLREMFDDSEKAVKVAIVRVFAETKEKKAFSFFIDHMDEPVGKAGDPNNSLSAAQWKARFEEWRDYKQYVRGGLKAITGTSFATAAQWKDWANGPGKKAGFVYRTGN